MFLFPLLMVDKKRQTMLSEIRKELEMNQKITTVNNLSYFVKEELKYYEYITHIIIDLEFIEENRDWVDYRLQTLRASPTATDTYQAEAVSSKYVDNILLKENTKIFKNSLVVSTGKNAQGEISYAAFRIASTNYRFRGEVAGSDKASGFLIESKGMNDCVYVFESFIDAMSHANLYNIKYGNKDAWKLHNRLALGGTADTALMELLKRKPNIRNICLCLDNDSAGRTAAKEIASKLRSMGYVNVYERYPNEKDYNDELKKIKSIINEQAEENEQ